MDFRSAVFGSLLKAIGNLEKSNMKMGLNIDPIFIKIFEQRILEN